MQLATVIVLWMHKRFVPLMFQAGKGHYGGISFLWRAFCSACPTAYTVVSAGTTARRHAILISKLVYLFRPTIKNGVKSEKESIPISPAHWSVCA